MNNIQFVNCTPHAIALNDGTVFPTSGTIARVSAKYTEFDENGVCKQVFGDVENVPAPKAGTIYIVSALVLAASDRTDLVAPATGHPDCKRNDKGLIDSVPGFVRK